MNVNIAAGVEKNINIKMKIRFIRILLQMNHPLVSPFKFSQAMSFGSGTS